MDGVDIDVFERNWNNRKRHDCNPKTQQEQEELLDVKIVG